MQCFRNNITLYNATTYVQNQGFLNNGVGGTNNIISTLTSTPGLVYETEFNLVNGPSITVYTDYDTISARYGCTMVNGNKQEYFYIMARSRGSNDYSKLFLAMDALKSISGVDLTKLQYNLKNDITCTN